MFTFTYNIFEMAELVIKLVKTAQKKKLRDEEEYKNPPYEELLDEDHLEKVKPFFVFESKNVIQLLVLRILKLSKILFSNY